MWWICAARRALLLAQAYCPAGIRISLEGDSSLVMAAMKGKGGALFFIGEYNKRKTNENGLKTLSFNDKDKIKGKVNSTRIDFLFPIINDLRFWLPSFPDSDVSWVQRGCNLAAHRLACMGLSSTHQLGIVLLVVRNTLFPSTGLKVPASAMNNLLSPYNSFMLSIRQLCVN
ncbi:hypothetical protein DVH24_031106 [Malus domestica]|uniref:RNase H type-1 domain-containing protein n=1 Tax=Malus domestica TaxID=3750 RepID=A0A498HIL1_MALDO|nr:hypothetical protein DVH24_031106 [Malus domestica]